MPWEDSQENHERFSVVSTPNMTNMVLQGDLIMNMSFDLISSNFYNHWIACFSVLESEKIGFNRQMSPDDVEFVTWSSSSSCWILKTAVPWSGKTPERYMSYTYPWLVVWNIFSINVP